eukprot:6140436-Prymnesium_polylepis.1
MPGAVDNAHLELLKRGAIEVAADPQAQRADSPLGGGNDNCVRLWVKEAMPDHSADADDVLRQVLSLVDSRLSLLVKRIFGAGSQSLCDLHARDDLTFNFEPAIN